MSPRSPSHPPPEEPLNPADFITATPNPWKPVVFTVIGIFTVVSVGIGAWIAITTNAHAEAAAVEERVNSKVDSLTEQLRMDEKELTDLQISLAKLSQKLADGQTNP